MKKLFSILLVAKLVLSVGATSATGLWTQTATVCTTTAPTAACVHRMAPAHSAAEWADGVKVNGSIFHYWMKQYDEGSEWGIDCKLRVGVD